MMQFRKLLAGWRSSIGIKAMNDIRGVYRYDEACCGGIPSPESAKQIMADLKSGGAIPHAISEPGYVERLNDIVAGRAVDPAFFRLGA